MLFHVSNQIQTFKLIELSSQLNIVQLYRTLVPHTILYPIIFFVYIKLQVVYHAVHGKEGGDITVPEVLVLQCADESVVKNGDDLLLQRIVSFVPDAEQQEIDLVHAVQLGYLQAAHVLGDCLHRFGFYGCPTIHYSVALCVVFIQCGDEAAMAEPAVVRVRVH